MEIERIDLSFFRLRSVSMAERFSQPIPCSNEMKEIHSSIDEASNRVEKKHLVGRDKDKECLHSPVLCKESLRLLSLIMS